MPKKRIPTAEGNVLRSFRVRMQPGDAVRTVKVVSLSRVLLELHLG